MTELHQYMQDGANYNARAVLCLIQNMNIGWNMEYHRYDAEFKVSRWENYREQGYVVILWSKNWKRQLNIAFFEHRNSDNICALKWEQKTINAPTIDTADIPEYMEDKYAVSHSVSYNQCYDMAEWIKAQFEQFWKDTQPKEATV